MPIEHTPLLILFCAGLAGALIAVGIILWRPRTIGNPFAAAALAGGFGAYTVITMASEGVWPLLANQMQNLWGVQVWWDLLFSVGIALFLVAPRARAQGMNLPLWTLAVILTASIALLAMLARLFWLERRERAATPAEPARV